MKLFLTTQLQKDEGLWGRSSKDRDHALYKGSCPLESREKQPVLALSIQTFPQGCNTAGMGKKSREKSNQNNSSCREPGATARRHQNPGFSWGLIPSPAATGDQHWEPAGNMMGALGRWFWGLCSARQPPAVPAGWPGIPLHHSHAMGRWHHLERNPPAVVRAQ